MKVLVVLTELSPYGGTLRFLERVLEIHARQGIETVLLAPDGATPEALAALIERFGVPFLREQACTSTATAPFLTPYFDFLYCREVIRTSRPDLVLVSTADPGRMSVALYLPCPVLYVLHSVPAKRFRTLPRLYLWLGSRLDNLVVAVSEAAAREVARTMGIPRSRMAVLHNSCPFPAPAGKRCADPLVLTVGHVVDYKNPRLWLEVARAVIERHPGVAFAWLGDGELIPDLRREVEDGPLKGKVHLPGYVADPSAWFRRASVYLQPSLRESHGIAVLEAMSYGVPCVVSDAGGLPESVLDAETGYVCRADDVSGFAGRVESLLCDPAESERLGKAGAARVEAAFSPALQERRLLELYRRLVEREDK